jgi:dTDP-glucose pyrophosphorylase
MNAGKPTLVILAAGLGSRYGGLKQLEPVGPGGATIMDYSIFDALRAGFGRIVFVIRAELEEAVRAAFGRRYEAQAPVAYAHQRLEDLPSGFTLPDGRTKPWGTGHAVLAAAGQVDGPFAVVNADDFYGAKAFAAIGEFLRAATDSVVPTYAMVGYTLRDTLSDSGTVSRGLCRCASEGWLECITEVTGLARSGRDACHPGPDGTAQTVPGDTLVSMNIWGFQAAVFDQLRSGFRAFLAANPGNPKAEFYLPAAIQEAIRAGGARVRVLPAGAQWCGVTHPQDRADASEFIHGLVARGDYPAELWR